MAWDADGYPMDDHPDHHKPVPVPTPRTTDLFKEYRDALSFALSDGNTKQLNKIHEAIKASVRVHRA